MLYTQRPHPKSPTFSFSFTRQLWPPKPEWRSNLWWLLGRTLAQWEWDSLEKIFTPLVCLLPSFFSFSLFLAALQGVQDLSSPDQRGNVYPLPWECRVLTSGMPRKFLHHFLKTLTSGKPGLNTQGLLEKWGWFSKPCIVLGTHTHMQMNNSVPAASVQHPKGMLSLCLTTGVRKGTSAISAETLRKSKLKSISTMGEKLSVLLHRYTRTLELVLKEWNQMSSPNPFLLCSGD